jgi:hypothetical protein
MKRLLLLILLVPVRTTGQFTEDFSDGELANNPVWLGDTSKFRITSSSAIPPEQRPALQLYAEGNGTCYLMTACDHLGSTSWGFWAKMSFNASSNNLARVYLVCDQADPSAGFRGYYLQLGGNIDSVWFCRQDSLSGMVLLQLPVLFTGNSTNTMRIKIIREETGEWEFYGNPEGEALLTHLGNIKDTSYSTTRYFGISCTYTSSNSTKFYFDELFMNTYIPDTLPPVLLEIKAVSENQVNLIFDEAIDLSAGADPLNYDLDEYGNPSVVTQGADPSVIRLGFDQKFHPGQYYSLHAYQVRDLSGNTGKDYFMQFRYCPLFPYQVLFTEIMADPTPSSGLPEFEYIEILNRAGYPVELDGCSLFVNANRISIPTFSLDIAARLLLVQESGVPYYTGCAQIAGVPSLSLPNDGADLLLSTASGVTLDYIRYDRSYYHDEEKAEGGWSVERLDPEQPCLEEVNWAASTGAKGGTPCHPEDQSSVFAGPFDVRNACCKDDHTLVLTFDRKMDSLALSDPANFTADGLLGNPSRAIPVLPGCQAVCLSFTGTFLPGQLYTLEHGPGLSDCMGGGAEPGRSVIFGLPAAVEPFGVVFNEILVDPIGDGEEYIELYNCSGMVINSDSLILGSIHEDPLSLPDTVYYALPGHCRSVLPGGYLLLTPDADKVSQQYYCPDPGNIAPMVPFPLLDNTGGKLILAGKNGKTIDVLTYNSEEMHFPLLSTNKGVALERIRPCMPGDRPDNWNSASQNAGFGTPGYANSQFLGDLPPGSAEMECFPDVFSPDGDGKDDVLTISCRFDHSGISGQILIFDRFGRKVCLLADNQLMGTENVFTWDGIRDDGILASPGPYIVFGEWIDMKTRNYRVKKVITLLGR